VKTAFAHAAMEFFLLTISMVMVAITFGKNGWASVRFDCLDTTNDAVLLLEDCAWPGAPLAFSAAAAALSCFAACYLQTGPLLIHSVLP